MNLKKILVVGLVSLLCFSVTGCGNSNVKLDLNKVKTDVYALTEDQFNLSQVYYNVGDPDQDPLFDDIYDLYDFDLEMSMNINKDNIEQMSGARENDESRVEMYLVLKPVEGKKDVLKNELDAYFSNLKLNASEENKALLDKMIYEEYEGCLIYIVSSRSEQILKRIKESKSPIYGMLVDLDDETLESLLGVKKDDVEEYTIAVPMITQSSTFMVVKPKKGKKSAVKKTIDEYFEKQEEQWKTYLPDQYDIIKNRTYKEIGDYLVYVASVDNDKVIKAIEANKIK